MALKIQPLADRVLVEPMEAETTTASGIIIPDNAKEKPQKGKVIAIGNGKKDEPLTVKVGDTVLYGKYSGTELKLDGKDYLMMRESDILAIIPA
jgi:chaperonin GroES